MSFLPQHDETPFEQALHRLRDQMVSWIVEFATKAGSKVRGQIRNLVSFLHDGFVVVFQAWWHVALPYCAIASLGWPLVLHGSIFTWWGYVGAILVFGPPAALVLTFLSRRAKTSTGRSLVPITSAGPLMDVVRQVPNVPNTPSGYGFWLIWVVIPSALITLITEVGWTMRIAYFVEVHDSWFAWLNVAPIDTALSYVKGLCVFVHVCANV